MGVGGGGVGGEMDRQAAIACAAAEPRQLSRQAGKGSVKGNNSSRLSPPSFPAQGSRQRHLVCSLAPPEAPGRRG